MPHCIPNAACLLFPIGERPFEEGFGFLRRLLFNIVPAPLASLSMCRITLW